MEITADVKYDTTSPLPCVVVNFPHINNNFMVVSYYRREVSFFVSYRVIYQLTSILSHFISLAKR